MHASALMGARRSVGIGAITVAALLFSARAYAQDRDPPREVDAAQAPPERTEHASPAAPPDLTSSSAETIADESGSAESLGRAFVHVEGDADATLWRRAGRFPTRVCEAPCDAEVDVFPGKMFFLEGTARDHDSFMLVPGRRHEVRVEGDEVANAFGFALLTIGGSALGAGGFAFAFHVVVNSLYDDELEDGEIALYGALIGGGALLLPIGIGLFVGFEPELVVTQTGDMTVSAGLDGLEVRF